MDQVLLAGEEAASGVNRTVVASRSSRVKRLALAASLILWRLSRRMCLSFSCCSFKTLTCSLRYSMAFQSSLSTQYAKHVTIVSQRFSFIAPGG